jgi:hypothetical protein
MAKKGLRFSKEDIRLLVIMALILAFGLAVGARYLCKCTEGASSGRICASGKCKSGSLAGSTCKKDSDCSAATDLTKGSAPAKAGTADPLTSTGGAFKGVQSAIKGLINPKKKEGFCGQSHGGPEQRGAGSGTATMAVIGAPVDWSMGQGLTGSWEQAELARAGHELPGYAGILAAHSQYTGSAVPLPEDQLFMFSNNQVSPQCCDSATYSTSGGCVCTSPEQLRYINQRGGNRTVAGGI